MSKVIGIVNQKGGVGKTTTAINLGVGLVKAGKKVLIVDMDPQGSLSAAMGYRDTDQGGYITIKNILERVIEDKLSDSDEEFGILKQEEGIDIVPANIELAALEVSLVNVMSRERILAQYIDSVRQQYDYILLDSMPSLGMITINVLAASDSVLIPVQAAYLPVKGLQQLIQTVMKVKRQINPKLEIEGILLTLVDKRTKYAREIEQMLRDAYGHQLNIYEETIPLSVRAAETSAEGKSIFLHAPNAVVAKAYIEIAERIIGADITAKVVGINE